MIRRAVAVASFIMGTNVGGRAAGAQQVPDTTFDVSVSRPAHTARRPVLAIDEAHRNFHTASGRYAPFAALMRNDGYRVTTNTEAFSAATLRGIDVLVVANAASPGSADAVRSSAPAFTPAECDAVREWVNTGGSLLLIADHAPFGRAAAALAERFGVSFGQGYALDSANSLPGFGRTWLTFESDRLGAHVILRGRDRSERIRRVVSFAGQSMSIPPGGTGLLVLSATARETPTSRQVDASRAVSAAGRAQGIAMSVGRGRVVMLGEAAMMSAQVSHDVVGVDGLPTKMGMNVPGSDDKQFALNIVRWLSRILE